MLISIVMNSSPVSGEVKRVGRFGLIGMLNTLLDFGIYNLLANSATGLVLVRANIISSSIAMVFSFFANKRYVFKRSSGNLPIQAITFFALTAFGLYILQNGVIYFLTEIWTWPLQVGYALVNLIGLGELLSQDFITKNGAKLAATAVSLVWNYVTYKKFVFKV